MKIRKSSSASNRRESRPSPAQKTPVYRPSRRRTLSGSHSPAGPASQRNPGFRKNPRCRQGIKPSAAGIRFPVFWKILSGAHSKKAAAKFRRTGKLHVQRCTQQHLQNLQPRYSRSKAGPSGISGRRRQLRMGTGDF